MRDSSRPPCPRCAGFVYLDPRDGDWQCVNCGWVQPPAELLPKRLREREPNYARREGAA